MLLLLGIPLAFGLWDDDRLHMTDDYAAITAGVSVTVLLICVVELHLAAGRAKGSVEANSSMPLDYDLARPEDQMVRNFSHTIWWLAACVFLCVSLLLTALWAAIEDHGPAPLGGVDDPAEHRFRFADRFVDVHVPGGKRARVRIPCASR
ncbi:hypothetical protein H4W23_39650 [Streptomyces gardneri]|uniref:hypothetical protein n=1 Tax=Streptomyces gardneri TaxID=66892 RepID=UPI0012662B73|nr:hypothetical protein [Streptomyces gardneri]QPK50110.1 hypothetical protein H4W23_39650 [Streptomyces gardneri]WRK41698.1 hypothetical protein U0M97_39880 [Streptomyces venezuelae]